VPKERKRRALAMGIISALIGLGLLTFILNKFIQSGAIAYLPAGVGIAVYLVVIAFLFILALLWILFPVFVYFSLERMNRHLAAIERNSTKP